MKWSQLKEFVNSLSEQELNKKVIMWREDSAITKIEAEQLQEDFFLSPENDDYCFSETDAKALIQDKEDYPNGMKDFKKVYSKGHPLLFEDF